MSIEQPAPLPIGAARTALILGILSIVLLVIFFFTSAGTFTLYASMAAGLAGAVFGIVALKRREFVGVSVTGLVLGALGLVTGISILVFAMLFVGAIG